MPFLEFAQSFVPLSNFPLFLASRPFLRSFQNRLYDLESNGRATDILVRICAIRLFLVDDSESFRQIWRRFVVIGDYQGFLHGLSREDGRFAARIKLDGSAIGNAAIEMDNGLLVQTRSGGVYSLSIH